MNRARRAWPDHALQRCLLVPQAGLDCCRGVHAALAHCGSRDAMAPTAASSPSISNGFSSTGRSVARTKSWNWLPSPAPVRNTNRPAWAWLISAYSLTGRDKEARATLDDFKQAFPTYTLPQITEIYTKENQFDNDTIKAATEHLFAGLKKAGLQ